MGLNFISLNSMLKLLRIFRLLTNQSKRIDPWKCWKKITLFSIPGNIASYIECKHLSETSTATLLKIKSSALQNCIIFYSPLLNWSLFHILYIFTSFSIIHSFSYYQVEWAREKDRQHNEKTTKMMSFNFRY